MIKNIGSLAGNADFNVYEVVIPNVYLVPLEVLYQRRSTRKRKTSKRETCQQW